jgi:hypothetical protein
VDDLDELMSKIKGNIVINTNKELSNYLNNNIDEGSSQEEIEEQIPIDIPYKESDSKESQQLANVSEPADKSSIKDEDTMEYRVVNLSDDVLDAEKIIFGDSKV